ncbi:PrpF domain-containing protein [Variovorax sp. J22P240]|uniref:PrpF domain-containing protein n=1 Tax=Variovorax sp. J22P240 TaxID=3053514 RepID=UPI002578116F|nr:PrpF domain-containing protein [Variovorax sp. J22P240]MDM0002568.1 PrpF domain-containing protein [Variovorax sp. J22P240]
MSREKLPFVLMRGGTSKGVFLKEEDVPSDRAKLTDLLLDLFGSPDRRQIDGLGGADKLTSKAAIIGPPSRGGTDVDYLFGQVGTVRPEVDYNLNCGNLTAAVGVYAIEEGFVAPVEGTTVVRVHTVNTNRVVRVEVPVKQGRPVTVGNAQIGGVPGTGAPISLDFAEAVGSITGTLLPTGNVLDLLDVPGVGHVEASIVDGPNLAVYVHHSSLGMSGVESPDEIDSNEELKARMDAIRKVVAYRCGLREYWDSRLAPSTPMLIVLSGPQSYRTCTQSDLVAAESFDLVVRQYASGSASKTLAGTLTATTGVACRLPGSLPHRLIAANDARRGGTTLTFGHPSGVINVDADLESAGFKVRRLVVIRTARRLAEGSAFLKRPF